MTRLLLLACCALPAWVVVPTADAATLKPYTALNGPVVRLSDLFDGADNRPLGPSPAPGGRISVDAPQLTAIAHMFGVDWRSAGPGDRAVLERPGRSLSREDILAPLRMILQEAGAARDSDIELPSPTTAPLPAGVSPVLDFSDTEFNAGSGRFTTMLHVAAEGVPTIQLRLSGRVQEMIELPVPRRAMLPGDVVRAADLQWTRLRIGLAHGEFVRTPAQAEGQALRRSVQPGMPLMLADIGQPVVVTKGTPLMLLLDGPGLQLTAQGVATEPGGISDHIHVSNPYSHMIIEAEITGPGQARVVPGAARPAGIQQAAAQ